MTSAEYRSLLNQARAQMREKNYAQALEILEYLHHEAPQKCAPLFLKALCHSELGQAYECERAYQKCLTDYPAHPARVHIRYCYAMFLANVGYFRDAITQFHQCIADGHDTSDLHYYLAATYVQLEDDLKNAHKHLKISLRKKLTWNGIVMLLTLYKILFLKKLSEL